MKKHIILYDGICSLCSKLVRFILPRDKARVFQFFPLQGEEASNLLRSFDKKIGTIDTIYVIADYGESHQRILQQSDAVLFILKNLSAPWPVLSYLRVLPLCFRNWVYNLIAHNRYAIFGKEEVCYTPEKKLDRS